MQIAVFISTFPGVYETFIINQITGLIDHGHIVAIYALKQGEAQAIHEHIIDYDLLRPTTYLALNDQNPRSVTKALRLLHPATEAVVTIPALAQHPHLWSGYFVLTDRGMLGSANFYQLFAANGVLILAQLAIAGHVLRQKSCLITQPISFPQRPREKPPARR
jgi:hypothetical protein